MSQRPIPIHVGSETPTRWREIEELQRKAGSNANPWLRDKRRPAVAGDDIDWVASGLEPRWIGFDTADCAAALAPSVFHGQGADEFDRFRDGAANRGEIAIVISPIGGEEKSPHRMSIFQGSASVSIGGSDTSIAGRQLGLGAGVQLRQDLGEVDRQLGLRLLNLRPAPQWYRLTLESQIFIQPNGARVAGPPEGTLFPILETELGEPVVAVWLSTDGVERRYLVPSDVPWLQLLSWLSEQALPEFVPGTMERARRHLATDPSLMTRRERGARDVLADLEADYVVRKERLTEELLAAETAARSVREGLLYGTAGSLVKAVQLVLEAAGITVVDVDEMLGDTSNADLLCTFDGRSVLVEVKSASGSPSERLYQDMLRHLREWPHLPHVPHVDGGALIVNHQTRKPPQERDVQPFTRPEFLAARSEPVVTTLGIFEAWREEDWDSVRILLFGEPASGHPAERVPPSPEPVVPGGAPRKRGWFGRRTSRL